MCNRRSNHFTVTVTNGLMKTEDKLNAVKLRAFEAHNSSLHRRLPEGTNIVCWKDPIYARSYK